MKTEEIKQKLTYQKPEPKLSGKDFVSTGSTMLNLACTDHPDHGFAKGHCYLVVGTSRSGKTWLAFSCLAEAARNKNFKHYRFIHNDVERGALMDVERFFGQSVAKKLRTTHSFTIEDFYYHLDDVCKKGNPFIYILDSIDALTSEKELAKFQEKKKAHRQDKEVAGSYGDGKAAINSACLRLAMDPLEATGSILIIINQVRDKLTGYGGYTRSGGHAPKFYATLEIWSDIKSDIKVNYKGRPHLQGVLCKLRVKKNRVTGKDRTIFMPIYNTYGMDDIGSCVDFLVAEKHWKRKQGGIVVPELDFVGKRTKLIKHISDQNLEKDLGVITADVWNEIEQAVAIHRKPRYL
jgi:RecA/RadA recombinase